MTMSNADTSSHGNKRPISKIVLNGNQTAVYDVCIHDICTGEKATNKLAVKLVQIKSVSSGLVQVQHFMVLGGPG